MQTHLADFIRDSDTGREAERILRSCTHCGFCLATCPTYQELGDELDSPRGRIYLVKQVLEGAEPGEVTQRHLDRCLSCRACESTCPSGVQYARLADIGRELIEGRVPRRRDRLLRWFLCRVAVRRHLFAGLLTLARMARPLVPARLRHGLPPVAPRTRWPDPPASSQERVVLLEGCVQPAMTPATHPETARLLGEAGIETVRVPAAGCCGALAQHLGHAEQARRQARQNIDAWWPQIEAGAAAVVANASGCALQLADYGRLLTNDPAYAEKARKISKITRDPVELLEADAARVKAREGFPRRIAFHAPCTLRHGRGLHGRIETLLHRAGFELTPVGEPHSCCGSAGSYSLLQPELADRLRRRKLDNIEPAGPELIATANVGCQTHLGAASQVPVRHWVELVKIC